jgi:chaperonin GroES
LLLAAIKQDECYFLRHILKSILRIPKQFSPSPGRVSASLARHYQNSVLQMEECMQLRPLHDRVVVKRIEAEEKSAGGIIIPDTAREKPQEGEIIAVGPGGRDDVGKLIPIDLKVGDRVLFTKWSGTEVKLDGIEYLIMKESDVMGVLEEPATRRKAA